MFQTPVRQTRSNADLEMGAVDIGTGCQKVSGRRRRRPLTSDDDYCGTGGQPWEAAVARSKLIDSRTDASTDIAKETLGGAQWLQSCSAAIGGSVHPKPEPPVSDQAAPPAPEAAVPPVAPPPSEQEELAAGQERVVITKDGSEEGQEGIIEFQFNGQAYRVRDEAAFLAALSGGPPIPPSAPAPSSRRDGRGGVSELLRARRAQRSAAAVGGQQQRGSPVARPAPSAAPLAPSAASPAPASSALRHAWSAAKEEEAAGEEEGSAAQ